MNGFGSGMPSQGPPPRELIEILLRAQTLQSAFDQAPSAARLPDLVEAIRIYESTLNALQQSGSNLYCSTTQTKLGDAYAQLPMGDRRRNLERAISYYEQALRVCSAHDFPVERAAALNGLGNVYTRLPTSGRSRNLERAITCYEEALPLIERDFPKQWAMIQNNLGTAIADIPLGDKGRNLERAILCYGQALRVYTERDCPREWAMAQHNLGDAYQELPLGDQGRNLERAIGHYEQVFRVFTEREFPMNWATSQNCLGAAYARLPVGERARNIERAIACYEHAMRIYTERDFPVDWARIQHNVGVAHYDFPTGDQLRNLERAITCFERALTVLTESDFPVNWASTQNSLGNAYLKLPTGARGKNLEYATACFERALRVRTKHDFPMDWAMTLTNLGNAYSALLTGDRRWNLNRAVACYEQALQVRNDAEMPLDWAMTQNSLGNAYQELSGEEPPHNLERAIACYERALSVYTENKFPMEWSMTQNNLGNTFARLPMRMRSGNFERVTSCFKNALKVRTPNGFPYDCLETLTNLGEWLFSVERWNEAFDAFEQGMDVTEQIRLQSLDETGRRRSIEKATRGIALGVTSAIRAERYGRALELAGRGKTRNLADNLQQREIQPLGVVSDDWREYLLLLDQARDLECRASGDRAIGQQQAVRGMVQGPINELRIELERQRESIRLLQKRFAALDPDYVPLARPLGTPQIQAIANKVNAVLLEYVLTFEGGYVFLVGPEDESVGREQVVEISALTTKSVRAEVNSWLRAHYAKQEDWPKYLEEACGRLYLDWFAPVHQRLRERYPQIKRLVLLPSQGLSLLPFHAAWWVTETGERRYLLDEYEISYAPSCLVLDRCLARERSNNQPAERLFAVQNPDGSLRFADWEVEAVASHFPENRRIVLKGALATEELVRQHIGWGEEKLFSTHGWFDPADVDKSYLQLHEGKLALADILRLDLSGTWLVVMSACVSGLTDLKTLAIDEYHGLPSAFLVARAQTVVASLWSVDDAATAILMRRFHANLYEKKMAKAEALCEAQRWLRDLSQEEAQAMLAGRKQELFSLAPDRMAATDAVNAQFGVAKGGAKPFANPFWWAAFQCVGAGWPPPFEEELGS